MTTIKKGAPPPKERYPFSRLKPGEYFSAPIEAWKRLRSKAARRNHKTGATYSVRKYDEKTVRVYRVR